MMEETSSDEQPEIVTREEVEEAEKEATKSSAVSKSSGFSNLPSPSPLPSIMTSPTSKIPSSGVSSPPTISTPTVSGVLSHAPNVLKTEPASIQSPHVPRSEPTQPVPASGSSSQAQASGGLLGWISGNSLVSKVVEKTKYYFGKIEKNKYYFGKI
ncbi:hypothetical protein LOTGIDRAFT_171553 [Lottia gigantea]|uniref:Uncharacterized protein n=1 Tax=Lottia gigantea TaxID=225164 RepID=V4AZZ7_LOTGI|nr:hypothetical protein LOTGIDRAFT_171553 [Lottia gigantea]ESP03318.1 hypothetical protein LOTGIDRAFT_171553 [Lottia gigantea]